MSSKNIKISEITHEQLEIRKEKGDTFDDVLKRELGIFPKNIEELVAFYPQHLSWGASESLELISEEADLREVIVEHDDYYAMNFEAETGHTILQARFYEDLTEGMSVRYRDAHGEFQSLVQIRLHQDVFENDIDLDEAHAGVSWRSEDSGWTEDWSLVDQDKFLRDIKPKIRGSKRRWGSDD